jgi:hypothetical protein
VRRSGGHVINGKSADSPVCWAWTDARRRERLAVAVAVDAYAYAYATLARQAALQNPHA